MSEPVQEVVAGVSLGWAPALLLAAAVITGLQGRARWLARVPPILVALVVGSAVVVLLTPTGGVAPAAGLRAELGFSADGLMLTGFALTAILTAVATWLSRTEPVATQVAALVLAACLSSAWLAGNVPTLAISLLATPLVFAVLVPHAASGRIFVGASLAGLGILGALVVAVVEQFNASYGTWTFALAGLSVQPTPALEPLLCAALTFGSLLLIGAWPVHGWVAEGIEGGSGVAAVMVLATRWLGLGMLLTIGSATVASTWFEVSSWLAALACAGALVGALASLRAASIREFLARSAPVPAGLALVGVVGGSPEGIVGGFLLAFAHSVAAAGLIALESAPRSRLAGLLGLALAGVPGFASFAGFVLITIGTARFTGATIPNSSWIVLGLVVAWAAHCVALARVLADTTQDAAAPTRGATLTVGALLVVLLGLGLAPQRFVERVERAARVRVDALYRGRCVALVNGPAKRARLVAATPEGCEAAVRTVIERSRPPVGSGEGRG